MSGEPPGSPLDAVAGYRSARIARAQPSALFTAGSRPNQLRARRLRRLSLGCKCGTDPSESGVSILLRGSFSLMRDSAADRSGEHGLAEGRKFAILTGL